MKLAEMVHPTAIIAELQSTDRNGVIRELVQVLTVGKHIDGALTESVTRSIISRERQRGTTGFGKGVAAPHAKLAGLKCVVGALGRSSRGIDFSALDGGLVYSVFLILSPADEPDAHLRAMDQIFRHLQQQKFRKFLRQSDTVDKLHELLVEADDNALTT